MQQKKINRSYNSPQFKYLSQNFKLYTQTIGYQAYTIKNTNNNINEFFAYLETKNITILRHLKPEHISRYIEYLQNRPLRIKTGTLKASYINKHITSLRLFGRYLKISGQATISIKPKHLETEETATFLTIPEIKQLYKAARSQANNYDQRDTAMLHIFYGCGLRASEGAALNISDILFKKKFIYVRKGKNYRERYVPMNRQIKKDLKKYIAEQRNELRNNKNTEALLLSKHGNRWGFAGMYHRLRHLKIQTNNKKLQQQTFGLHILRHSAASHLLQSGMKLELISKFLGHKSLESTQKYTHLSND